MSVANPSSIEFEPLSNEEIVNIINESSFFISQDVEFEETELVEFQNRLSVN